jgi:hypothetical protein
MVTGADYVIHLFLQLVSPLSIEADLVTKLKISVAATDHLKIRVRGLVVVGIPVAVVFNLILRRGPVKRASHAGATIIFPDAGVAACADGGIHIAGFGESPWRLWSHREDEP